MMSNMWHYGEPDDGILRVRIDQTGRPVNTFSRAALEELSALTEHIGSTPAIKAVIFSSSKPGNFIAGADITEFKDMAGADEARAASKNGQRVFQQVADLKVPTLAMISGACLGGGLEFAAACDYRIADDDRKTLIGLPEVMLGLIPGWGGTVRVTKIVGLLAALPLILAGKMLKGRQARSIGLVHDVVPKEAFESVAQQLIDRALKSHTPKSALPSRQRPLWKRAVEGTSPSAKLVLNRAEKEVQKETHGHYPAPFEAIKALRAGVLESPEAGFHAESEAVSKLAVHPVTTELIRLFFLQEEAKKPPQSLKKTVPPNSIEQGAVVGAGAMGAGIALLMAQRGIWTRLKDLNAEFVSRGVRTIRSQLTSGVRRRRMSELEATRAFDHISPTTDYRGLTRADIVIEAIVEDLEVKRTVFGELAEATNPKTVLATNTSSLLVSDIAKAVPHPERVVGLHFFNPPHRMPLVEVVRTPTTSAEALATAVALVQRLGKTMVLVGDCPGFLVNRLLAPYMNEAGYLLAEVPDPMEIDRAAIAFGFPMGPLELTDLVGVDVAAHVAQNMWQAYGDRMKPAPLWDKLRELRGSQKQKPTQLVKKTRSGKKLSGPVAHAISELRRTQSHSASGSLSSQTIIERLVFPVINEAALCLNEGVVERPDDIDLAMVFGTGFAPFRGGPMRYAASIGVNRVVETLERFAAKNPRLAPSDALKQLAQEGTELHQKFQQTASPALA